MNYSKMLKYDASNWDGITATIFFSGCKFRCPGCFNSELWDFKCGQPFDKKAKKQFISYAKNPHVDGVCLLGGEISLLTADISLSKTSTAVAAPLRLSLICIGIFSRYLY